MKLASAALLSVLLSLTGCASVDDKIIASRTAPTYSLCEALVTATFADSRLRAAWAEELANRGEDCSRFGGTIAAKAQADANFHQAASQLRQQVQQPRGLASPVLLAPAPVAVKGILKRNFINGATKVCVYDRLGTEYYVTIPPQNFCPSMDG